MWRYIAPALALSFLMASPARAVVIDNFTLPSGTTQTSAPGGGVSQSLNIKSAALSRQLIGHTPDAGMSLPGALSVSGSPSSQVSGHLLSSESASILYDFGTGGFDFQANHTLLFPGFRRTGGDANQAVIRALVDGVQFGSSEWEGRNAPGVLLTNAPIAGRFLELQFVAPDTTVGDGDDAMPGEMSNALAFSFTGSSVVAAPEPGSLVMLASLGLVAGVRHRKRRHAA